MSLCTVVTAARNEQDENVWEEQLCRQQAHGADSDEGAVEVEGGGKVFWDLFLFVIILFWFC